MKLKVGDLRSALNYDALTGEMHWLRDSCVRHAGDVAGCLAPSGYRKIGVNGHSYYAHRLAWLWMTGKWPQHEIDHINGLPGDNRWCNLRAATPSQNQWNRRKSKGRVPLKGVSVASRTGRYQASIRKNRKLVHLGTFDTAEAAHGAYVAAASTLFGEFAHS